VAVDERLAARLRLASPPVVGRLEQGRLLLDLRCVPPALDEEVAAAVVTAAEAVESGQDGGPGGRTA
jgi:L-seryl-tRNA(Ser) seleniumtransferase